MRCNLTQTHSYEVRLHPEGGMGCLTVELKNRGPGRARYSATFLDGNEIACGDVSLDGTDFSCRPSRRVVVVKLESDSVAEVWVVLHKGVLLEDVSWQRIPLDRIVE